MTRHAPKLARAALLFPLLVGCLERPVTPGSDEEPPPAAAFDLDRPDGAVAAIPEPAPFAPSPAIDTAPAADAPVTPWVDVDASPGAPPADVVMLEAWDGASVGWSPDGREVWIAWDGEPGYHATLVGEAPDGARLLPLLEAEGFSDIELLLVEPGQPEGTILRWWAGSPGAGGRMWVAPAPGSADPDRAFRDTVALRYLRTCPGLMETCALYGTPADVQAAVDPVQPLGGWFLRWEHGELEPADEARDAEWTEVARFESDGVPGVTLEIEATPADRQDDDDLYGDFPDHLHRAFLVHGGQRTHAFDFVAPLIDELSTGGVARDGDRLVAWLWRPDFVALEASEHDASTGRRLGTPIAVMAEPYFDVECGYVLYNTRPMPVRTPDGGLGVALYWGTDDALLFARDHERGDFVTTGLESETLEPWGEDIPAVLHIDPVRDHVDPDDLAP